MTRAAMLTAPILLPKDNWVLEPADAAVAIIVVDQTSVLMQHRDTHEGLIFPGYWGLFGGGLDKGEEAIDALIRELYEEIRLTISGAEYFTALDYDFEFCGKGISRRQYYVVHISSSELDELELHEGDRMETFGLPEILVAEKVMPFDAWALWMYANREALAE